MLFKFQKIMQFYAFPDPVFNIVNGRWAATAAVILPNCNTGTWNKIKTKSGPQSESLALHSCHCQIVRNTAQVARKPVISEQSFLRQKQSLRGSGHGFLRRPSRTIEKCVSYFPCHRVTHLRYQRWEILDLGPFNK